MIIGMGHDDTMLGNTFGLDISVWGNVRPLLQALNALGSQTMPANPISNAAAPICANRASGASDNVGRR